MSDRELINQFVQNLDGRLASTHVLYGKVVAQFLARTGASPQFKVEDIRTYRTSISKDNRGSTVATKLAILQQFFKWAVKLGWASEDCIEACVAEKYPHETPRCLSRDEINTLLAHATGRWVTAILLAADLGLRESEIRGAKWDAVDLERMQVRVVGKGQKLRVLPIVTDRLANHLRKLQPSSTSGYLVPGECGNMLASGSFAKYLSRLSETVGIEHANPHAFRHGFAGSAHLSGVPVGVLQHMLGHSSITTTQTYLQSLGGVENLRDGMAAFAASSN